MRRVVVTGLGAVTPLGVGVRRTWQRLLNGECGIVSTRHLGDEFANIPSQVAGLVPVSPDQEGSWKATDHVTSTELRQTAKFAQYGLAASAEALKDAGFENGEGLDPEMTGVCLGSGIGNLEELYETSLAYHQEKNYRKIHPLFVPRLLINLGAGHISMRYGLKGPNHAVTTACTTGAHSLGDASRFIKSGEADVMIAGGAEACIHPLAIGGFARSRSLATNFNDEPQLSSRPFDKDRAGFVIGEGAACVILEELEHAKNRGARIYAELVGYGNSADAHHLTAPREDGSGALLAMKKALKQAQIPPSAVDYINAHATSTPLGDAAEYRAVKALMLGEHGRQKPAEINVSSTKGAIGHLLGAAGAVEAVFTVLAIHQNVLPPTINLVSPSEGFDCNNIANSAQPTNVQVALTNSFGFGGTNASLCFKRAV
ncbi:Mitochondrial beta-keto-acyl synthase [Elasticomyces elasticus]|uniref:3-oxoacyl-[acyl-carrier-protein] synthase n=1 Tax=Exophiala sideris TaxID=1016849 RepID=A0ABR0IYU0_9EURO|nr:Mitochondrial beta-keto-acyl synthase [Elasticomyces elasticus]KAK5022605.1 Mitochondrial beta-keto-acyl synthase [Exophiala sideris]KAK5027732.1 Mitochondrial beta-keto-acyl synthase [Exophiala sideris]KAK5052180.1 Mitochondrial beta-keto-acyl synthase [Exophiala sideris]KAK5178023.1 Mitochondrial beta-keto-acyl synthase [Eurotiomycetes sp. CCFEE 6388]